MSSMQPIGKAAGDILTRVIRAKQDMLHELHKELEIPKDYYKEAAHHDGETLIYPPIAPLISEAQRDEALEKLVAHGIIKTTSMSAIIERMAERLGAKYNAYGKGEPDEELPPVRKQLNGALGMLKAKQERAREAILDDPTARTGILARRAAVSDSCILETRKRMKAAGLI